MIPHFLSLCITLVFLVPALVLWWRKAAKQVKAREYKEMLERTKKLEDELLLTPEAKMRDLDAFILDMDRQLGNVPTRAELEARYKVDPSHVATDTPDSLTSWTDQMLGKVIAIPTVLMGSASNRPGGITMPASYFSHPVHAPVPLELHQAQCTICGEVYDRHSRYEMQKHVHTISPRREDVV